MFPSPSEITMPKCETVETKELAQALKKGLDYDELMNCMRCGFCLPACPTYRETGLEAASPRGRIALMKAVADQYMTPDQDFVDQMNLCLGCRACEPACPSGVKYGHLLEQARDAIEEHSEHPWWIRGIRSFAFRHLFPKQNRLYVLGALLAFYQKSGLQWFVHKIKLLHILPKEMREMEAILPSATGKGLISQVGNFILAQGEKVARVGMFRGCIMDILFNETNKSTVELLSTNGFEVVIPETQNCCGALHAHSGEQDLARKLARSNIKAFRDADVDYIVTNAGGCGALLSEYDHLLKDDSDWQEHSKWFADRVIDISQLLVEHAPQIRFTPLNKRISYQDSCHLRNVQRVNIEPRKLLRSIPEVEYVELFEADRCCGSAGIYNLVQPEFSAQILNEKMEHVKNTQADLLVTANPGCLLQMKLGIHQAGLDEHMEAVHIVDLLAAQNR